jgi:Lon protease-like protein
MPMFPLSTVVFPESVIPLHIFEPRYRQLTTDCLAADARFGIVLIERGREVGGGDQRASVGTVVEIVRASELTDGRWLLLVHGESLLQVNEWLPDDPYPQAMVQAWLPTAEVAEPTLFAQATQLVRRTRALLSESGQSAALSPDTVFADDPETASWQLCAEAPVSTYDAQRLLMADGSAARLRHLIDLMEALEGDLHQMMGVGDGRNDDGPDLHS